MSDVRDRQAPADDQSTVWPPPPRVETPPERGPAVARFRPVINLARGAEALIVVNALCNLDYALSRFLGQPESLIAPAASLTTLTLYVAAIVYSIWVYRIYANLPGLGAKSLKSTPGWVVGYHFIPILAYFKPYQLLNEAWKASEHGAVAEGWPYPEYKGHPLRVMAYWWATWVIWNIGELIERAGFRSEPRSGDAIAVYLVLSVLGLVCGTLAVFVIEFMTRRQEATALRLAEGRIGP